MAGSCGCGCGHDNGAAAAAERDTGEVRIGDLARDPAARAVLERFGLNHCCGAHLSLREGTAAAGVELAAVVRALMDAARQAA
jgi:iron-sulfur cluster repair protein YtfE (RIC family)